MADHSILPFFVKLIISDVLACGALLSCVLFFCSNWYLPQLTWSMPIRNLGVTLFTPPAP